MKPQLSSLFYFCLIYFYKTLFLSFRFILNYHISSYVFSEKTLAQMNNALTKKIDVLNEFFSDLSALDLLDPNSKDYDRDANVENILIRKVGQYFVSPNDRAKIVLKNLAVNNDKNYHYNIARHSCRHIVGRIMKAMKGCDLEKVFAWTYKLQQNDIYREEISKCQRNSRIKPKDNWTSVQTRIWNFNILHLDKKSTNCVIIMPSKNDILKHINIDKSYGMILNVDSGPIRVYKNNNRLYPFSFMINLDKLSNSILNYD